MFGSSSELGWGRGKLQGGGGQWVVSENQANNHDMLCCNSKEVRNDAGPKAMGCDFARARAALLARQPQGPSPLVPGLFTLQFSQKVSLVS